MLSFPVVVLVARSGISQIRFFMKLDFELYSFLRISEITRRKGKTVVCEKNWSNSRSVEPQFAISFQKRGKNQSESFEFEFSTYELLSEIEISSMVDSLKNFCLAKQHPDNTKNIRRIRHNFTVVLALGEIG